MELVLDNNILFSVINPRSAAAYLFSMLRVDFSAPEFLKSEFNEHRADCLFKSKLSEHEFETRQAEVENAIKFFKLSEYDDFLELAANALPDSDDADFVALALSVKAAIWSNDPHLKQQSLVKVYSTEELIGMMLNEEI